MCVCVYATTFVKEPSTYYGMLAMLVRYYFSAGM